MFESNRNNGEAWRIRTSDSLLKRQELYQAELTPHALISPLLTRQALYPVQPVLTFC